MTMNQKGFANIILGVIVVMLVGVVGYFAFVKKSTPIAQQTPTPTPTQTQKPVSPMPTPDKTANWKTYTNAQYGFEFKYPTGWVANEYSKLGWSLDLHEATNSKNSVLITEAGLTNFVSQGSAEKNAEYMNKNKPDGFTEIPIGGGEGFYGTISRDLGGLPEADAYLVGKDHIFLMIIGQYGDKSLAQSESFLNQILSTFKFTK